MRIIDIIFSLKIRNENAENKDYYFIGFVSLNGKNIRIYFHT